jgi:hypothetical protein
MDSKPSAKFCNDAVVVFGDFAEPLRQAGFAVLPARGKSPRVSGFTTWKSAPGKKTIDKWARELPGADIV